MRKRVVQRIFKESRCGSGRPTTFWTNEDGDQMKKMQMENRYSNLREMDQYLTNLFAAF